MYIYIYFLIVIEIKQNPMSHYNQITCWFRLMHYKHQAIKHQDCTDQCPSCTYNLYGLCNAIKPIKEDWIFLNKRKHTKHDQEIKAKSPFNFSLSLKYLGLVMITSTQKFSMYTYIYIYICVNNSILFDCDFTVLNSEFFLKRFFRKHYIL